MNFNYFPLNNYAVRFVITNSKSGININDQWILWAYNGEEEVVFAPWTHWRVQKNRVDHNKKTILLILEWL